MLDTNGAELQLSAKKSQALLAYLACNAGTVQSREKLAGLLWGESSESFARTNLRQTLAILRKTLQHKNHPCILNSGEGIYLDSASARVDVLEFQAHCSNRTTDDLLAAVELYRGDLLDTFSLNEIGFDEWVSSERRRNQESYIETLRTLCSELEAAGDFSMCIQVAGKLLAVDPLQEDVHRSLMRCYRSQGRWRSTLQQYEDCKSQLQTELGVEPETETRDLYNEMVSVAALNRSRTTSVGEGTAVSSRFREISSEDPEQNPTSQTGPDLSLQRSIEVRRAMWIIPVLILCSVSVIVARNHLDTDDTAVVPTEFSATSLPSFDNKPSIAVLPFKNLDANPEQVYLSDGLTEDLTTDLSRVSGLKVIASNSSFIYKDSSDDIRQIAADLGVTHLVQGSVRKIGERIRVNAKLIDAQTGSYLWADRFDHPLADILDLQDEVTRTIVNAMSVTLTLDEDQHFANRANIDPDAYDLLLRGLRPMRQFSIEGIKEAREFFIQAAEIDPSYARAYANLALTYGREVVFRLAPNQPELIKQGLKLAATAEKLDRTLPQTQFARGVIHLAARNHEEAIKASRKSIELDKNYADGYAVLAQTETYGGSPVNGLSAIRLAKELHPLHPFSYLWVEGHALFQLERYEQALPLLEEVVERNSTFFVGLTVLLATLGKLGMLEEAEWYVDELLILVPDFNSERESNQAPYRFQKDRQHYLDGLRLVGLPG